MTKGKKRKEEETDEYGNNNKTGRDLAPVENYKKTQGSVLPLVVPLDK